MAERVRGERDFAAEIVAEIKKGEIPVTGDQKNYQYLVDALETAVNQHWLVKDGDKYKASSGKWKSKGESIIKAMLEREDTRRLVSAEKASESDNTQPQIDIPVVEKPKRERKTVLEIDEAIVKENELFRENREDILKAEEKRAETIKAKEEKQKNLDKLLEIDEEIKGREDALSFLRQKQVDLKKEIEQAVADRFEARLDFNTRKPSSSVEIDGLNMLSLLDKISNLDQLIIKLETEYAKVDTAIENEKFKRAKLEHEQKAIRSKIAMSELGIVAADLGGNVTDLIKAINDPNKTPLEILELLHQQGLTEDELQSLSQIPVDKDFQFKARHGFERKLISDIAERLRHKANKDYFLHNQEIESKTLDEKYRIAISPDTNLTTLLQIAGREVHVLALDGLIEEELVQVNPSGEVVPLSDKGKREYGTVREELIETIRVEYQEQLRRNVEGEKDPLVEATEKEIFRLNAELMGLKYEYPETKQKPKFPFNNKGKFYNRFWVSAFNKNGLEEYDKKVEEYHKLEERISNLEIALRGFAYNKAELIDEYVELRTGLSEGLVDFDPLNPNMKKVTELLGESESLWPLETFESAEAKYLQEQLGDKFKRPERSVIPSLETLMEEAGKEVYDDMAEKYKEELTIAVDKILDRRIRGIKDPDLRIKIKRVAFNSAEFKAIVVAATTEKGIAKKLSELGSVNNNEYFDTNTVRVLLGELYDFETGENGKGAKRIDFIKFVEELTVKYKFNQITREMEEGLKVSMAWTLGAENPNDSADKTIQEVLLSGRNCISDVLKEANMAHHAIISASYSVGEFGTSVGEAWNGLKLALGGENSETFEKKLKWNARKDKLNRKNERHKGLLSQLYESFMWRAA